jgi:hypothetical protein
MRSDSFSPTGKTVLVAGATSAPTALQVSASTVNEAGVQYRIHNAGTVTAFIAFGATAAAALANAVIPTGSGSNAKDSYPLPGGSIEVLSAYPNAFFTAITGTSTASIYITPGKGL